MLHECKKCDRLLSADRFYVSQGGKIRKPCKECVTKQTHFYYHSTDEEKAAARQARIAEKAQRKLSRAELRQERNQNYAASTHGRAVILRNKAMRRHKGGADTLVTLEKIKAVLETGRCEKSGVEFDFNPHPIYSRNPYSPSVDRIDSFGDYTDENTQIVCNAYNQGKNQMSDDEFLHFCREFVAFADRSKP